MTGLKMLQMITKIINISTIIKKHIKRISSERNKKERLRQPTSSAKHL